MKNISLRHLKVFESVARHLNYTRAAEEFFLSQPAVSMQVKQLEEQLGVALFEQLGKRIHSTEAGQEVLMYARTITQQLDEMEAVLNRMQGGRLRISVATTANYFIPALLGTFSRRYPQVTVSLHVTNRETLLRQLTENIVDLVIMGQQPTGLDVEAQEFMNNPLVVGAPIAHPLAKKIHPAGAAARRNLPGARIRLRYAHRHGTLLQRTRHEIQDRHGGRLQRSH